MKSHTELGKHILTQFAEDEDILEIVRHHPKHHRGNGYSGRLNGEQISIGARILAVQQMHDDPAGRPSAMNARTAYDEIRCCGRYPTCLRRGSWCLSKNLGISNLY